METVDKQGQAEKHIYRLAQVTGLERNVHDVEAYDIEGVREWAKNNVDTTKRWLVYLNGVIKGEGASVVMYQVYTHDFDNTDGGYIINKKFMTRDKRVCWFFTEEEAWADYRHCKQLADEKFAKIEKQLADLRENLEFDFYLLHNRFSPDAVHLGVVVGGYKFYKGVYQS